MGRMRNRNQKELPRQALMRHGRVDKGRPKQQRTYTQSRYRRGGEKLFSLLFVFLPQAMERKNILNGAT